ncbi:unnamed protein product [Ambrosiozyma monospora]|uniref:Unnamed protein product n=1 Tax=Ambrosiozyma monospora TaxID=43982 RepID=A0ACB5SVL6_AMBMO|nr:unnamed protein product [Ambrosiozyma monospora]
MSFHYSPEQSKVEHLPKLRGAQRSVYNSILKKLKDKNGSRIIFLSGPSGSGKTLLLNHIINVCDKDVLEITSTNNSGSTLLKNSRTLHSAFGIPIVGKHEWTSPKYSSNLEVLIIDDVNSLNISDAQYVDNLLREKFRADVPFGGIAVLLAGNPMVPEM